MDSVPNGFARGNSPTPHTESIAIFWRHVNKDGPVPPHCPERGPCWEWRGSFLKHGYGRWAYRVGGQRTHMGAHRFSALIAGIITDGAHALHHCDNPPCCNPAHLYAGSNLKNIEDRVQRGRQARGVDVRGYLYSKILAVVVREIREAHGDAEKIKALALRYDVHASRIRQIARGAAFAHVP